MNIDTSKPIIPEKIIWLLKNAEFLCIASLDAKNNPRVANKFLIKCSENSIYFGDFAKGKTYRNLKNNPQVSIAIMDTENLIDYQVNGRAQLIQPGADYKELLKEYSSREVRFSTKRLIEGFEKRKESPYLPASFA